MAEEHKHGDNTHSHNGGGHPHIHNGVRDAAYDKRLAAKQAKKDK